MEDKKHPCPDCQFCQWCSDIRCRACLGHGRSCKKKLSMAEQIELYEKTNREYEEKKEQAALASCQCRCKT